MNINRAQAVALRERFLDNVGTAKPEGELPIIEAVLGVAAKAFIDEAAKNLDESGSVTTGELVKSLTFEVQILGDRYTLSVGYPKGSPAAKYWDFNNKGVQGVNKSGNAPNSPYKFRYLGVSPKHALAILKWVRRNGMSARNSSSEYVISSLETKRSSLRKSIKETDKLKSMAFAMAASAKREGLKPSGFFDKAVSETFGPDFMEAMQVALGGEVILSIRKYKDDI